MWTRTLTTFSAGPSLLLILAPLLATVLMVIMCLLVSLAIWYLVTAHATEKKTRVLKYHLPGPSDTLKTDPEFLCFDFSTSKPFQPPHYCSVSSITTILESLSTNPTPNKMAVSNSTAFAGTDQEFCWDGDLAKVQDKYVVDTSNGHTEQWNGYLIMEDCCSSGPDKRSVYYETPTMQVVDVLESVSSSSSPSIHACRSSIEGRTKTNDSSSSIESLEDDNSKRESLEQGSSRLVFGENRSPECGSTVGSNSIKEHSNLERVYSCNSTEESRRLELEDPICRPQCSDIIDCIDERSKCTEHSSSSEDLFSENEPCMRLMGSENCFVPMDINSTKQAVPRKSWGSSLLLCTPV